MTRKSPRKKSTESVKEQTTRKPRKSPHCTKCPGRPLRSQCTHTAKGKRLILEQTARAQFSNPHVTGSSPQISPQISPGVQTREHVQPRLTITLPPTPARQISTIPICCGQALPTQDQVEQQASFQMDPRLLDDSQVEQTGFLPQSQHPPAVSNAVGRPPFTVGTTGTQSEGGNASLFTPCRNSSTFPTPSTPYVLNTIRTPTRVHVSENTSPLQNVVHGNPTVVPYDPSVLPSALVASRSSSPADTTPLTRTKRNRATASNPFHGHVAGVMRGESSAHELPRTHKAPQPIEKRSQASRAFLEGINSVLIKCEDISLKTGCWLFVGAQHANAASAPLHYAPPRLRKDGGEHTNDFASHFLELMKQVSELRRVDVRQLQGELQKSQQAIATIEASKGEVESRLEQALKEIEALKGTSLDRIRNYRANLGLA